MCVFYIKSYVSFSRDISRLMVDRLLDFLMISHRVDCRHVIYMLFMSSIELMIVKTQNFCCKSIFFLDLIAAVRKETDVQEERRKGTE